MPRFQRNPWYKTEHIIISTIARSNNQIKGLIQHPSLTLLLNKSNMPSFSERDLKIWTRGRLVRMSAIWSMDLILCVLLIQIAIFSLKKWTSIWKCFDLAWKTGLLASWRADLLSQWRETGRQILILRSFKIVWI